MHSHVHRPPHEDDGGHGLWKYNSLASAISNSPATMLHDFKDAKECFPGNPPKGGVCYFLWDKNYDGDCEVYTHHQGEIISKSKRPLLDEISQIFIRENEAVRILDKVRTLNEESFVHHRIV